MIITELIDGAARTLAGQMDAEIRAVLNEFCPTWTMIDVKNRCQMIRYDGSPVETLCMDGVPLLEMHPIESIQERTHDRYIIRYTRNFRRLRAPRSMRRYSEDGRELG